MEYRACDVIYVYKTNACRFDNINKPQLSSDKPRTIEI